MEAINVVGIWRRYSSQRSELGLASVRVVRVGTSAGNRLIVHILCLIVRTSIYSIQCELSEGVPKVIFRRLTFEDPFHRP